MLTTKRSERTRYRLQTLSKPRVYRWYTQSKPDDREAGQSVAIPTPATRRPGTPNKCTHPTQPRLPVQAPEGLTKKQATDPPVT